MVEKLRPLKANIPKLPTISDQVYNTKRWRELSKWVRRHQRVCANCGEALAEEVHHVVSIEANPRRAFDPSNLVGLCIKCHSKVHEGDRIVFGRAKPRRGHTPPI